MKYICLYSWQTWQNFVLVGWLCIVCAFYVNGSLIFVLDLGLYRLLWQKKTKIIRGLFDLISIQVYFRLPHQITVDLNFCGASKTLQILNIALSWMIKPSSSCKNLKFTIYFFFLSFIF